DDGGNLRALGPVLLEDVRVTSGEAQLNGGGISSWVDLELVRTFVGGNSETSGGGAQGGGGLWATGRVRAVDSTIDGNFSEDGGGAYVQSGDVVLVRTRFSRNVAADDGGGLLISQGSLIADESVFADNEGWTFGGGLTLWTGAGNHSRISDSSFSGNEVPNGAGAAIAVYGAGSLLVERTSFRDHTGDGCNLIDSNSTLVLREIEVLDNAPGQQPSHNTCGGPFDLVRNRGQKYIIIMLF
ncbi:MAG: right-handed parallel beta-helix repeat-containing protein, partial [Balneolales bacterium]|nr:right-handed parallel beta-helix repeat-containing protein [Balneolales bacterium]